MGKKDLTDMLGGGGGRTKQKYRCKADGCQVTPMGVNLAKHYKVNTDWVLLKELKACVGDAALKKKMDQTDPHTRYIFEKGYSKKRLPHWSHHARVTETLVTREEDGGNVVNTGQKKKINQFFQVGVPTFFEVMYLTLKIPTLDCFISFQKQHFCGRRFFQKLSVALMRGNCALLNNRASD